ncbi:hypothetical protein OS493_012838 [Desmophyllum pertusum]|uniref:Uncharacterized protein n=1 Tax=Desmophyllum pertusum TaxID=174260 RepID=A0A9W9Z2R0_9CNID|nr:hypothetical protein OS493_012838 [Desmophyllum pertusum]
MPGGNVPESRSRRGLNFTSTPSTETQSFDYFGRCNVVTIFGLGRIGKSPDVSVLRRSDTNETREQMCNI